MQRFHFDKDSLKSRLLMPIALGGFSCALIASGLQFVNVAKQHGAEHVAAAEHVIATVAVVAESEASPEMLQSIVEELATKTEDVAGILVVAHEPQLVLAGYPPEWKSHSPEALGLAAAPHSDLPTTARSEEWIDLYMPATITAGSEAGSSRSGAVLVRVERHGLHASSLQSVLMQSVWIMVLTLLCLVGAYFLFDHTLFRRLASIGSAIQARQEGDPESRAPVDNQDEVSGLARVLNHAFDEIADRETRFRSVVDTAAEGIVIFDHEGRIGCFNAAAEEIFGYTSEEALTMGLNRLLPTKDAQRLKSYVADFMGGHLPDSAALNDDLDGIRKDGSNFPLEASIAEMVIGDQRYFTGMLRDITDRREAERALRDYAHKLEQANQKAEDATRAKSAFLANMSHEIRTPMTAILGYVDLMGDGDMSAREREDALGTIRNNGEHLLSLINDILDISKVEAGRMEVERIDTDLAHMLLDVENLLRLRAEEKGIQLVFEQDGALPRTVGTDPTRVRQILVNLIGNAIKFTEEGRVRVCAALVPHDGRNCIRVRIEDSGIGMSGDQIKRLFQPFSQADTSTTRRFGGTGLGLVISERLAKLLGGAILVESVEGKGSVFTIGFDAGEINMEDSFSDLHQVREKRTAHRSTPVAAESSSIEGRVLLVEDNAVNQQLIKRMIEKAGASVETADNGRIAVDRILEDRAKGGRYDLVFMDMLMPILDGYEATAELRTQGYDGPVVALTGNAMEGDRERCLKAGCDDYLTKPIDRKALSAILVDRLAPALATS